MPVEQKKISHASDAWIKIAALGEAVATACNNYYLWAQMIDDIYNPEEAQKEYLGFSNVAFFISLGLTIFVTLSSVYCHYLLNTLHHKERDHLPWSTDPEKGTTETRKLRAWEKLVMLGDCLGHIGEFAGGPNLLLNTLAGKYFTRLTRSAVSGGLSLASIFTSRGSSRTCQHALRASHDPTPVIEPLTESSALLKAAPGLN